MVPDRGQAAPGGGCHGVRLGKSRASSRHVGRLRRVAARRQVHALHASLPPGTDIQPTCKTVFKDNSSSSKVWYKSINALKKNIKKKI